MEGYRESRGIRVNFARRGKESSEDHRTRVEKELEERRKAEEKIVSAARHYRMGHRQPTDRRQPSDPTPPASSSALATFAELVEASTYLGSGRWKSEAVTHATSLADQVVALTSSNPHDLVVVRSALVFLREQNRDLAKGVAGFLASRQEQARQNPPRNK